jgi:hypothetical protein
VTIPRNAYNPTERQLAALRVLARSGPWSPGHLGARLWSTGERQPQHYARPAGLLLWQLRRKGLAEWFSSGWVITAAGLRAVQEAGEAP